MKSFISTLKEKGEQHKIRHRPTGLGIVLADRLSYLNAADWDQVVAGQTIFLSRRYLTALWETRPSVLENRYAMIYREARPVAVVAVQLLDVGAEQLGSSGWAKQALRSIHQRLLICGNVLSWGMHGIAFASGEDPKTLWPSVAEALYRLRRAEKLTKQTDFILIKDLRSDDPSAAEALRTFSYRPIETDPDMVLDIPAEWKSFDDYLKNLTAKYRSSIVKHHKMVDAAGFRVERLTALAPEASALHGCYLQVLSAAAVKMITMTPAYLPALASALGDDFRCTVIRDGSKLIGFMTVLKDGDTGIAYYVGFDRASNEKAPIYFRLLGAAIEDAITWGCRRLSFGRTALEPKARLGARPVPTSIWLRHRNPIYNLMARQLLGAVPHHEAPDRQPFRVG